MGLDKKSRSKKHKAIWITAIAVFLVLSAAFLYVGFGYIDYTDNNPITILELGTICGVKHTFYLFNNQIYTPVAITEDGKINTAVIPYYYGSPSSKIATVTIQKKDEIVLGDCIGQAKGDFLGDRENVKNDTYFYAVNDETGAIIPDILWARKFGQIPYLTARIVKPYSKKMLNINSWVDFAKDLSIRVDVDANYKPGIMNPLNGSIYYQADREASWSYRFKRNWAFFFHDVGLLFKSEA